VVCRSFCGHSQANCHGTDDECCPGLTCQYFNGGTECKPAGGRAEVTQFS
jgi:hypothetical protein